MSFSGRHPHLRSNGFYRIVLGRELSTLGIGTYLGDLDAPADTNYIAAIHAAVAGGINVIDTAINYRHTRSEQNIGHALRRIFADGLATRDELFVCTKAGFLTPGFIPTNLLRPDDVASGCHCMAPDFLEDQIRRSLSHLGLDTLDLFYVHNPETQLQAVSRDVFEDRLRSAFVRLEQLCSQGLLRAYGTATWNGYRLPAGDPHSLSLPRIVELAREAAGSAPHHFACVQLPFNLAMTEALQGQPSLLDTAQRAGIAVITSAPLLQARLLPQIPPDLVAKLEGPRTPSEFALHFARSAPGVSVTLTGMGRPEHVQQNLALSSYPPAAPSEFLALFNQET